MYFRDLTLIFSIFVLLPHHALSYVCWYCNKQCDNPIRTRCNQDLNELCYYMRGENGEYRGCWNELDRCDNVKAKYNVTFCRVCVSDYCNSSKITKSSFLTLIGLTLLVVAFF